VIAVQIPTEFFLLSIACAAAHGWRHFADGKSSQMGQSDKDKNAPASAATLTTDGQRNHRPFSPQSANTANRYRAMCYSTRQQSPYNSGEFGGLR